MQRKELKKFIKDHTSQKQFLSSTDGVSDRRLKYP